MRRLVLVRHGESNWNAASRIQGQQCAGLSDRGMTQARQVGGALANAYPTARVVVSDLRRCRQTAQPLLDALSIDPVVDPRLRERSFGDWEGRTRDEVERLDPARWRRWRDHDDDVLAEVGGEPDGVFLARVEPLLRELLAGTDEGGVTIAVTHGGPIWHGSHALLGLPVGTLGTVHNASVTELVAWQGPRVVLERWNEVAHLPVELRVGWRPAVGA
ncbi:histidine phosphatase family protein [Egicoccus sp. AB-alg6-2]|uniref:histidine phosphatase family protein n=1 Tax=Egicoccus sp. AB-alg6-2 TaxID=3242692 RepID=UPI00359DCC28